MEVSTRRWLTIVTLIAILVRVGWVTAHFAPQQRWAQLDYPDEQAYLTVASSLAAGEGLVDEFGYRATYMPGYPAFLSLFVGEPRGLLGARLIQAILSAGVAPACFLLALRWVRLARAERPAHGLLRLGADRTLAIPALAGLAAACDPFLVFFSGLLLTEALFAAMLTAAWACLVPLVRSHRAAACRQAAGGACLLLGCLLLRPSAFVIVALTTIILLVARRCDRTSILASAMIVGVCVAGLFPWALRNHVTIGRWQWLTTRGGISLYDGLGPAATGASDLAETKTLPQVQGLNEIEWNRYFRWRAWEAVRRDPLRVVRLAGVKFLRTWSLVPHVADYRRGAVSVIGAAWTGLVLASAAAGWWVVRQRVRAWAMLLGPVVAITGLHMIFVGSVRYRVPVMPVLFVLSALGIVAVWHRLRAGGVPGRSVSSGAVRDTGR